VSSFKKGDVIQVKAFDLDASSTANSKIIYRIDSGNRDKFFIDSSTGIVKINENSNLDIDLFGSLYSLLISASDFGSMGLVGLEEKMTSFLLKQSNNKTIDDAQMMADNVCLLTIRVLDVNNKKPKFINIPE
jgi:hypothetical protein